jgi:SAM-dependent methyltransferase
MLEPSDSRDRAAVEATAAAGTVPRRRRARPRRGPSPRPRKTADGGTAVRVTFRRVTDTTDVTRTDADRTGRGATERFITSTAASYDAIARDYAAEHPDSTAGAAGHLERAMLGAFVELVREHSGAPVADIGSGPGHVTARLAALGVPVFGVDVSPRMVALARGTHPRLRFHVGSMTALDLPDGTLAGVLALYSTIHVPDEHLPAAFAEFHRVLVPGGHVLLAFQTVPADSGERHVHLDERYGHAVSLDYHWRTPETIGALLAEAGFEVMARLHREPYGDEKRPRGFVLARRR